jgi:cell shape-determining protein MreC
MPITKKEKSTDSIKKLVTSTAETREELSKLLLENQRLRERNCWVEHEIQELQKFGWSSSNQSKLRILEAAYSKLVNDITASVITKKILEEVPGLCNKHKKKGDQ